MKLRSLFLVALAVLLLPPTAAGASAAPPPGIDKVFTVSPGETYAWDGSRATGLNYYYYANTIFLPDIGPVTSRTCTKDPAFYCDQILVEYRNPLTQEEIDDGVTEKTKTSTVKINAFTALSGPTTEFDISAYASDPNGNMGEDLQRCSFGTITAFESCQPEVTTTLEKPSVWVLFHIVYGMVADGSYKGTLTF